MCWLCVYWSEQSVWQYAYGIHNSVCNWIEDFLTHRLQRVTVNNCSSSWLPCTSGIAQRSILGPILFIIYINDLPDSIMHSNIFLYADDAKILKRIDCRLDCLLLQRDIDSFASWCDLYLLKLNIFKCVYVRFGVAHRPTFLYCIKMCYYMKLCSLKTWELFLTRNLFSLNILKLLLVRGLYMPICYSDVFIQRITLCIWNYSIHLCVRFSNIISQYGHLTYLKI